jgi:hypothetical protein
MLGTKGRDAPTEVVDVAARVGLPCGYGG